MDELDDLATYNGNIEHDMWVDFTNHALGSDALPLNINNRKEYTGELGEFFDDADVDNFVDNLND